MNKFSLLFVFLALVASVASRSVTFSLVAVGSEVKVIIGDTSYTLEPVNTKKTLLYRKVISVDDDEVSYQYEVDGETESFTRTLAEGETTTHNEFFGRKYTVKELPQLSHPDSNKWKRTIGRTELFDDSYIPTVHITGDNAETLFTTDGGKLPAVYLNRIEFYLKDNYYSFKNVPCYPKNYKWDKMQFRVILNNDGIDKRYVLKFRDNNEDPSFLRQDLYGDIMTALGCPTIQSIKTRVYLNNRAVGYYILQEEAASESFVRATFHGKSDGSLSITDIEDLGHPLDCSTGADFYYTGNEHFGAFQPYNKDRYDNSRVKLLAKAFEKLNVNSSSSLSDFEKNWFDIDTFFKAIAMQYLTGHWDSYWFFSSNFAVYDDPTQQTENAYKFYFICQDWDGTFGLNLGMPYSVYDDEWTTHSYKDFLNLEWPTEDYGSPKRYAIDKLLSSSSLRARFEKILTDIVKYILNPNKIYPRIDALVERHREEIEWGYNVTPLRKGKAVQNNWTVEDFDKAVESRSRGGSKYGLKEYIHRRAKYINEEFNLGLDIPTGNYEEYSTDGRCGEGHGKCNNECCSQYGYCGTSDAHCGAGCQSGFGTGCTGSSSSSSSSSTKTTTRKTSTTTTKSATSTSSSNISTDGRCGAEFNNTSCRAGECCSKYNYCGTSDAHCGSGCQSEFSSACQSGGSSSVKTTTTKKTTTKKTTTKKTTKTTKKTTTTKRSSTTISTNGKCGKDNGNTTCPNSRCCSKYGYCGTTDAHCGSGCQSSFGKCN